MLKRKSFKKDLIITLSTLIAITTIAARIIGFYSDKHRAQETFDAGLIKSAKLVFALIRHEVYEEKDLNFSDNIESNLEQKIFHRYEYRIHIQAWEGDYLVYNSDNHFKLEKDNYEGFKDVTINNESWRSFAFYDATSKIKVLVAEEDLQGSEIFSDLFFSFIISVAFSLILLFVIVYITVNRKLKPLENFSLEIEKMSALTLQNLYDSKLPSEFQPFINSFNSLINRLRSSIDAERNFTNYAAHELKTPLTAINVQAHLLANTKNEEAKKEYAKDLFAGINRATHIINQLLILSRLESDNLQIEKEKINLAQLTKSAIKIYQQKAFEKNLFIEFICDLDEEKTEIHASKTYIEILISNLLDNAIKYSLRDQEININLFEKDSNLHLKISNHGEEILDEEVAKIFNHFYRINRLKSVQDNIGCGLGLAITNKIADLHEAEISFSSKNKINSVEVIF